MLLFFCCCCCYWFVVVVDFALLAFLLLRSFNVSFVFAIVVCVLALFLFMVDVLLRLF